MRTFETDIELTEEQEAEAAYLEDILAAKARVRVREIARLMASKSNRHVLGETEFQIRDLVHQLGAEGIDALLELRKKGGIKGRVVSVRTARKTRNSNATPASG